MVDLNALRDFLAVAQHGGFAEAGRVLGLPKSTLSRRVAALERELGVRLMQRTSRRLRLTAEGEALRSHATGPMAALDDIEDQVRSDDAPLTGKLRISVPVLFGHSFLGDIAARFAEAHPGVMLEAALDDRKIDLLREGFDAALRINPPTDSLLHGRRLGRNRLALVVAAQLGLRLGYREGFPEEIEWPAVIRTGWGDDGGWEVTVADKRLSIRAAPRLALSSPLAMRDAIMAGAGAGFLPRSIVRRDVEAGRLLELGVRTGPEEELWIVHASGMLPNRRLRAFIDLVAAYFAERPIDP